VPLEDLFSSTDELQEKMAKAENIQERTKAMLHFAIQNMINSSYAPDVTERLELLLCNARGNVRMKNVSECLFYSSRHCRGKFKNASGISPKSFASIMRFQHTVRLCTESKSEGSLDFNRIVSETGFYDQSHLILEFRRFAGFSPKHFFDTLSS
jgi:AraC-like DNA-binding protein